MAARRRVVLLVFAVLCAVPAMLPAGARQVPRLTGAALLDIQGNFCNLNDSRGRPVYTAVLPTVWERSPGLADEWIARLREAGSTHVFVNVPDGGVSYGGEWQQPDYWANLPRYRAFLEWLLAQPSANGHGFVPVVFLDHGGASPLPRIEKRWPRFAAEMQDLLPNLIGVVAFEPVAGHWTSRELSEALGLLHALMPDMAIGWHGSPSRWSGASDPVEPDDPWQGDVARFYREHNGEYIDVVLYQTEHGRSLYRPCDPNEDACWLSRWRDGVRRLGLGQDGWPRLPIVLAELTAYEHYRGQATPEQARTLASTAARVCEASGVACGFGNGLPH